MDGGGGGGWVEEEKGGEEEETGGAGHLWMCGGVLVGDVEMEIMGIYGDFGILASMHGSWISIA